MNRYPNDMCKALLDEKSVIFFSVDFNGRQGILPVVSDYKDT